MKYPDDFINKIHCADCLEFMKGMPDNSIDTIITDPPYGLSFMGKKWDNFKNSKITKSQIVRNLGTGMRQTTLKENINFMEWTSEWATEALRIIKPGGTMLCFGGSRTQHLITFGIELAGWIIKDTIMWLYGSGFPKATDIGKQIDKQAGAEREIIGTVKKMHIGGHKLNANEGWQRPSHYDENGNIKMTQNITAPATSEAQQWEGYKSHGLKPAYEPIIVAMKPNEGSYANNALKWGVAGLNIDGGRIGHNEDLSIKREGNKKLDTNNHGWGFKAVSRDNKGRFPANIILDEEAARLLDEQSGISKSTDRIRHNNQSKFSGKGIYGKFNDKDTTGFSDIGGASRFFYCAKASKKERNRGCEELDNHNPCYESHRPNYKNTKGIETPYAGTGRGGNNLKNHHPTVKPLTLMKYLVTLTTMPNYNQIYLDPFCGSGTTLMACKELRRNYIGIDKEKEYCEIARKRVNATPEPLFKGV
jgi:site-specific DNA-methyltransferase (adenine-specific)